MKDERWRSYMDRDYVAVNRGDSYSRNEGYARRLGPDGKVDQDFAALL